MSARRKWLRVLGGLGALVLVLLVMRIGNQLIFGEDNARRASAQDAADAEMAAADVEMAAGLEKIRPLAHTYLPSNWSDEDIDHYAVEAVNRISAYLTDPTSLMRLDPTSSPGYPSPDAIKFYVGIELEQLASSDPSVAPKTRGFREVMEHFADTVFAVMLPEYDVPGGKFG